MGIHLTQVSFIEMKFGGVGGTLHEHLISNKRKRDVNFSPRLLLQGPKLIVQE